MKKFDKEEASLYEESIRKKIPAYDTMHLLIKCMLKTLPLQLENILVIGAGTGEELNYLLKINDTLTIDAVEPSNEMASKLLEKIFSENAINRVSLINKNFSEADQLKKYQLITSVLVSHFVPFEIRPVFYEKISEQLEENGYVIVVDAFLNNDKNSDLNYLVWINFLKNNRFENEKLKSILNNFSTKFYPLKIDDFKKMINSFDLEIVDVFWQSLIFKGYLLKKKVKSNE